MEEIKTAEGGTIIKMPIDAEMKQAYIDYSMSVITSRALPDVRDGLKPVHGASLRLAIEFFATQKTRRRYFNYGANEVRKPPFQPSLALIPKKSLCDFFGTTGLHGGLGRVGRISD